jgi:hypothetical protein
MVRGNGLSAPYRTALRVFRRQLLKRYASTALQRIIGLQGCSIRIMSAQQVGDRNGCFQLYQQGGSSKLRLRNGRPLQQLLWSHIKVSDDDRAHIFTTEDHTKFIQAPCFPLEKARTEHLPSTRKPRKRAHPESTDPPSATAASGSAVAPTIASPATAPVVPVALASTARMPFPSLDIFPSVEALHYEIQRHFATHPSLDITRANRNLRYCVITLADYHENTDLVRLQVNGYQQLLFPCKYEQRVRGSCELFTIRRSRHIRNKKSLFYETCFAAERLKKKVQIEREKAKRNEKKRTAPDSKVPNESRSPDKMLEKPKSMAMERAELIAMS